VAGVVVLPNPELGSDLLFILIIDDRSAGPRAVRTVPRHQAPRVRGPALCGAAQGAAINFMNTLVGQIS
jgi:hypothetical protein